MRSVVLIFACLVAFAAGAQDRSYFALDEPQVSHGEPPVPDRVPRGTYVMLKHPLTWLRYELPRELAAGGSWYVVSPFSHLPTDVETYLETERGKQPLPRCGTGDGACPQSLVQDTLPYVVTDAMAGSRLLLMLRPNGTIRIDDMVLMSRERHAAMELTAFLLFSFLIGFYTCGCLATGAAAVLLRDWRMVLPSAIFAIFALFFLIDRGYWDGLVRATWTWLPTGAVSFDLIELFLYVGSVVFTTAFFEDWRGFRNWMGHGLIALLGGIAVYAVALTVPIENYALHYALGAAGPFASAAICVRAQRHGCPHALAFGIAWLIAGVGILLRAAWLAGYIPRTVWLFSLVALVASLCKCFIFGAIVLARLQMLRESAEVSTLKSRENRTLRALMRILSHDLSNTAMAVSGGVSLLKRVPPDDERFAGHLARLERVAKTQAQMLMHAKNVLRSSGEDTVLQPQATSVRQALETVRDLFETSAQSKGVALEVALPEPELAALADPIILPQQILANLVGNALKHTPPGKAVRVGATQRNASVHITVDDEGAGISDAIVRRLFASDTVERLDTSPGTEGELGTGVGLVQAKTFTEALGGRLELRRRNGEGTSAVVILPRFVG